MAMGKAGPERGERRRRRRTPGTVRLVAVVLALLAQLALLAYLVSLLRQNAVYLYFSLEVAGALAAAFILTRNRNSPSATLWIIVILVLPVFGYLLYLMWGATGMTHPRSRRIRATIAASQAFLEQDPQVFSAFLARHPRRRRVATYLRNAGFPLFAGTRCRYYPLGDVQFQDLVADLERAERFIFLEYFIVAEGQVWDRIHQVLVDKARQGVEVRILLDDFGSITKLSDSLVRELCAEGIQALRFNPVHVNVFRFLINYRNHQKITVIDGNVGYTGGTNIADEYANLTRRLGHWKDTAIRLEGQAVWGLTVTFLQMWDAEAGQRSDYARYAPTLRVEGGGFFQPFADGPVNNPDNPALDTYVQIISGAERYLYLTTPYLVIDDSMKDLLCAAARSGVDVRIVTPRQWDHWYVHMVTQSNYEDLLAAGVRVYEYTPGFLHSKIILSDDEHGVIGSINMDYRSFYLHFENGVWICGDEVLREVKRDLRELFAISREIELEEWRRRPAARRVLQEALRVFAPLF
ncbi:MAG: cardiolipin synthase [Syntrophomonadaceae bacterium]|nr:cardiolipin synthase [Syntrophomonadaceae bacterium]